jgi:uncharacterized protein
MARKDLIIKLALATLFGMPAIALMADHFSERIDLRTSLIGYEPMWKQILMGSVLGTLIALLAIRLVNSDLLKPVHQRYADRLANFHLNFSEIILISLCAGVGEELLFRGALQPFLGVVLTSMIFVAIHGYINPNDWRLSIYGIFMTACICGVGYFAIHYGLISAIIAHTLIDVFLLSDMQDSDNKEEPEQEAEIEDRINENTF